MVREGGEQIANQTSRQSQEKGSKLKEFLKKKGIDYDFYLRGQESKAEKNELERLSRAVATSEAQQLLAESDLPRKVEQMTLPVAGAFGPQGIMPPTGIVFPPLSSCQPEQFFACLESSLRWQLGKVSVCVGRPDFGVHWKGGEHASLTVTISNRSRVTWDNFVLRLKIEGPIRIVRQGTFDIFPDRRYLGRLDPWESASMHFELEAQGVSQDTTARVYACISGEPVFSPSACTPKAEYTIETD